MAEVVTLPTAATEPVPRQRWRGKYPNGVFTMPRQRLKREQKESERRQAEWRSGYEQARIEEKTVQVLRALLVRARKGQLDGVYVAFRDLDGSDATVATGWYE